MTAPTVLGVRSSLAAPQTLKGREVALIRSVNETHTKCCEPLKEHVGVIDSLNTESKRLIRLAKANLSPVCCPPPPHTRTTTTTTTTSLF